MKRICLLLFGLLTFGSVLGQHNHTIDSLNKLMQRMHNGGEYLKSMSDYQHKSIKSSHIANASQFNEKLYPTKGQVKYGFSNKDGVLIIPHIFDTVDELNNGFYIVSSGNYFGTIDENGNIVLPMKFSTLKRFQNNLIVQHSTYWGITDNNGNEILSIIYDHIGIIDDQLARITTKLRSGLFSIAENKWVIPIKYFSIGLRDNCIFATTNNKDLYWINSKSFEIIDSTYSKVIKLNNNEYFKVEKNNHCGIVSETNKIIIPIIYTDLQILSNAPPILLAKKKNKFGLITFRNEKIIDFIYDEINLGKNYIIVKKDNQYGLIDRKTYKKITAINYDCIYILNNDKIYARKNGVYCLLNPDGTMKTDFVYQIQIYGEAQHKYIYQKDNKYGLIDNENGLPSEAIYDNLIPYTSRENNMYHYYIGTIDSCKIVLDYNGDPIAIINNVEDIIIVEGAIIVVHDGKYGLIKKYSNEVILETEFDIITRGSDGKYFLSDHGIFYELIRTNEGTYSLKPLD